MPLDAAFVIRSGSGLLFTMLGGYLAARRAAPRASRALGVVLLTWGIGFVFSNAFAHDSPWPWKWAWTLQLPIDAVHAVAGAVVVVAWVRRDGRAARAPLALAGISLAIALARWVRVEPQTLNGFVETVVASGVPFPVAKAFDLVYELSDVTTMLAVYAGARAAFGPVHNDRHDMHVALGLGLFSVYSAYSFRVYPSADPAAETFGFLVTTSLLTLLAGPWLVAAARGGGRAAIATAWTFLLAALAGLLVPFLARVPPADVGVDPTGARGVVRTIAWGILVWGVVRHDILELGIRSRSVERSTVAAGALATLLIVAQVAQNFLSAQYGLLMGGVVAGALVVAASPLQRAMERVTMGQAQGQAQAQGLDAPRREQVYLNAARLAMRDRRLTRAEEAHLHALAEELGLGARRAHELLVQAESEAGVG